MSTYVAYIKDMNAVRSFSAEDCDTNPFGVPSECTTTPSFLLAAAKKEKFKYLLEQAGKEAQEILTEQDVEALIPEICDRFAVKVGVTLLGALPKEFRISAEVNVDLSHDTPASIAKADKILRLYEEHGIQKDRLLMKLALSWESIRACKALEARGIACSLALLQHQHYKRDCRRLLEFITKSLKLPQSPLSEQGATATDTVNSASKDGVVGQRRTARCFAGQTATSKRPKMTANQASSDSTKTLLDLVDAFDSDASTDDVSETETQCSSTPSDVASILSVVHDDPQNGGGAEVSHEHEMPSATQLDLEHLCRSAVGAMTYMVSDARIADWIASFASQPCTNHPTMLLAATKSDNFWQDLKQAVKEASELAAKNDDSVLITDICDRFAVKVGVRLLPLLPEHERIACEVDASLRFDTEASVAKASKMLSLYASHGIHKDRIVVKLAPSWESVQASRLLSSQDVQCNLSVVQHRNYQSYGKQLQTSIKKILELPAGVAFE